MSESPRDTIKMTVRVDEDLYMDLADAAEEAGVSLSAHVRKLLTRQAKHERARRRLVTGV